MKTGAILIALAIGCGGSSTKPAVQEPKPEPDVVQKQPTPACDAVASKIAGIMAQEDTDAPADSIAAKTEAVKTRCEADQWSPEARECFGTAENQVDAKGCLGLLTEAQMTAVGNEVDGTEPAPAVQAPPVPPEGAKAEEAAPRKSRGGVKKKEPPKSSSDPCMGGE